MSANASTHIVLYFQKSLDYVEERYYDLMSGNNNLIPFLKDNGEGGRLGTLAVFVDQGIIEIDHFSQSPSI